MCTSHGENKKLTYASCSNTFAWDVRTKKVTYESVPTVDGTIAIANYGPHAVLFTVGRNHTVQQYDLNPNGTPMLVKNVQHVPAKLPPSPPISNADHMRMPNNTAGAQGERRSNSNLPVYLDAESSEGESYDAKSPFARLTHDNQSMSEHSMSEQSEEELEERDIIGPLSPTSSRSSTVSRNSDRKKKRPTYPNRYERTSSSRLRPQSPGMVSQASGSTISRGPGSTVFSSGTSIASSAASGHRPSTRSSRLRGEVLRSPEEAKPVTDLFPFIRSRLSETPFRPPRYPDGQRSPDMLRREMLRTVFGWDGEVEDLIRHEMEQHGSNSSSGVLLAKWLGDLGADLAASMVGSQSMTSSDWMLLALSAVGGDQQKKVGDAFVVRLLEKGDIHPAVAILLGLGEIHEAIEIYVSRGYCLEAVLLCCLMTPHDWQRQSHLVRQWGEAAIGQQPADPELAVRCFACTSVQSSESWFSPAAKDAVYEAQMQYMGPGMTQNDDRSPASATSSNPRRIAPRQAGLKLITNFGDTAQQNGRIPRSALGDDRTPMLQTAVTPMDQSYTPMIGRQGRNQSREPMSSVTATPGGLTSRRMPSRGRWVDQLETPIVRDVAQTAIPASASRIRQQQDSLLPDHSRKFVEDNHLPSPAAGVFNLGGASARARNGSRDRKPQGLQLHTNDIMVIDQSPPSGSSIASYNSKASHLTATTNNRAAQNLYSPAATDASMPLSAQIRSLDEYVHNFGIDTAGESSRRGESRARPSGKGRSRAPSEVADRRYIQPGKRSPSSPVSMSPDDPALRVQGFEYHEPDAERYYRAGSPTQSSNSRHATDTTASKKGRSKAASVSHGSGARSSSKAPRRGESVNPQGRAISRSRGDRREASTPASPAVEPGNRGRSRAYEGARHSPDSPVSMALGLEEEEELFRARRPRDQSVGAKIRARAASQNRQQSPDRVRARARAQSTSRGPSPDQQSQRRMRSQSAKPAEHKPESPVARSSSRQMSRSRIPKIQTDFSEPPPNAAKRFTAAQELEARRRSLLRRPSAPAIPHPDEFVPRSATGTGSPGFPMSSIDHESSARRMTNLPVASDNRFLSEHDMIRSHTADPESQSRRQVGLPATPRAMRHPKYAENGDDAPAVPQIPSGLSQVQDASSQGSDLQILPSSSFTLQPATFQPPSRSASAPPEKYQPQHGRRSSRQDNHRPLHQRMGSLNEIAVSPPLPFEGYHNEPQSAVLGSSVMIIPEPESGDIILPELQHLAQQIPPPPPPPPPPPAFRPMSAADLGDAGVIDIAIDELTGAAVASPPLSQSVYSPPAHVRRPSADTASLAPSATESNKGGFLRGVRDRMTKERSASRNRGKSPNPGFNGPSPYESVQHVQQQPPPFARVGSCPPMAMHGSSMSLDAAAMQAPLTLLPAATYQAPTKPNSNAPRDPKAIARAMTAEQVQFGMDVPPSGLAAAIAQQQQPGALGLLPSTTYLPERPQTTAPQSNIKMPRGMEQYRDPKGFRADMPPTSTQPGAAPFMEGRPF